MNYLKRIAGLLALVLILVCPIFVAAESNFSYEEQAKKLNEIGLLQGVQKPGQPFDPDLGSAVDRQTAITMIVRMFGYEKEALAQEEDKVTKTLSAFSDADMISDWAKKYVSYAILTNLVKGTDKNTISPKAPVTGKDFCTLIMRSMGFIEGTDFTWSDSPRCLAYRGAMDSSTAVYMEDKELIRDDIVGIVYGSLKVYCPDNMTVIERLVKNHAVDAGRAKIAGFNVERAIGFQIDAAIKAINAYESADFSALDNLSEIKSLEEAARGAVLQISDSEEVKKLNNRIDTHTKFINDYKTNPGVLEEVNEIYYGKLFSDGELEGESLFDFFVAILPANSDIGTVVAGLSNYGSKSIMEDINGVSDIEFRFVKDADGKYYFKYKNRKTSYPFEYSTMEQFTPHREGKIILLVRGNNITDPEDIVGANITIFNSTDIPVEVVTTSLSKAENVATINAKVGKVKVYWQEW